MVQKRLKLSGLVVLCGLMLLLNNCIPDNGERRNHSDQDDDWQDDDFTEQDTQAIKYNYVKRAYSYQKTKELDAYFQFSHGEFKMKESKKNLASLYMKYRENKWVPNIYYNETADSATLKVKLEKNKDIDLGEANNIFAVALTKKIPIKLHVAFGAGEGDFDLDQLQITSADFALGAGDFTISLRDVPLENLDVSAGVGSATIDLSGKWNNDMNADFACGIGELKIILPEKTGARVEISGLFGNIEAMGMKRQERRVYVNKAFSKSKYTLEIDITGALGSISLEVAGE